MIEQNPWSLQRTIPLTFLLALAVQGAAIVWSASMMSSDIKKNTQDIAVLEVRVNQLTDVLQTQAVSLARIDENIKSIRQLVEREMSARRPMQ